ncbi:MAG TPA: hypothetical protein VK989_07755 [Polyangia bacterium]|nr:hypothetical protein [Polyangia bacterium]
MIHAAALATILWAQLDAGVAPAPRLPIELRWDAPAGCPDVDTVRAGIARGVPPTPTGTEPMHAGVLVTADDAAHWRAALELRGVDWTATRALKGPSCAAVSDAAELVIGMALTSQLEAREVVVASPPPPTPPPTPSAPTVALAFVSDVGTLPSSAPGGALSFGWHRARAFVDVRASLFASRTGLLAVEPDAGGRLSLASLDLRGCYLWGGRVSAGPCVGAGVDRLHATGTGPIMTGNVTSFAPFFEGGLQATWRMSRWVAPFVAAEAAIPLVRARFSVEDVGQFHQPAAVSFRGAAGLEVRFR